MNMLSEIQNLVPGSYRRAHARTRTRTTNKALKKPKPRSQEDEERHKDVASAKQGFLFPYHFLSLLQVLIIKCLLVMK
ncbi:hypothetical protein IMY05_003G0109700 [Salix suchowensis]|nr:hypothetical protein IMY05_003G0109700 [Salix suchowensis]